MGRITAFRRCPVKALGQGAGSRRQVKAGGQGGGLPPVGTRTRPAFAAARNSGTTAPVAKEVPISAANPLELGPPEPEFPEPDRRGSVRGLSRKGFHRVSYVEWGNPDAERVAICVHGLSRQGRDFDVLARALAGRGWRVICPDLPGRGQSDWLSDPGEYTLPQYAVDMTAIIARSGASEVDWIGTSLGGLTGIVVAGQPNSPVRRLVINDIGPFVPWAALNRLSLAVVSAPRRFADFETAVRQVKQSLAPFGRLSEAQWRHLTRHSVEGEPDGGVHRLVDPEITAAFQANFFFNLSLWSYWDAIVCPTLVLRGATSSVLLPATLEEMRRRGPHPETVTFPDCGHAPALMDPAQVAAILAWLQPG